jgi:pimeloyl-ACP methyl ester carboxylesterase
MRRDNIGLALLPAVLTVAGSLLLFGVSTGTAQAQTAPAPQPTYHVYLLRGLLNIFSLGLDEIGAKLQQRGISSTVHNHTMWASLADEAAAEYKAGRLRTIIIVGHSAGATAVTDMANRLAQQGVPVKLAIGLDSLEATAVSGRVERYVNFYTGVGKQVAKGNQFSGSIQNVDLKTNTEIGHFNIEKNLAIQERVIALIQGALASGRSAARHPRTSTAAETGSMTSAARH